MTMPQNATRFCSNSNLSPGCFYTSKKSLKKVKNCNFGRQFLAGIKPEPQWLANKSKVRIPALVLLPEPRTMDTRCLNSQFFAAQIQIPIPNKYLGFGYNGLVFKCNELASRTTKDLNFLSFLLPSPLRQNLDKNQNLDKQRIPKEFPKNSQDFGNIEFPTFPWRLKTLSGLFVDIMVDWWKKWTRDSLYQNGCW